MSSGNKVRLWERVTGLVQVELCAAFPESLLNACVREGLSLRALERVDGCTLRARVPEGQLEQLRALTLRQQGELRELNRTGGSRARAHLKRRMALPLSLLAMAALLIWSNLHVWEIEVRGCETLSEGQVRRALTACGVSEGAYWPSLSQDAVRDGMLLKLPALSWMTVNISGSRAVVTVVERQEKPEIYHPDDAADLIASRTGIVQSMRVLSGHPLVSAGSAVAEGETLVTGAVDSLTHPTRYVHAAGEVLADTWYEQTAVLAPEGGEKGELRRVRQRFALVFGKTRTNCFFGSKKELDGYDKIVHEYRVGVKGLFALPLALVREEYRLYERRPLSTGDAAACAERMREALAESVEGEILRFAPTAAEKDGLTYVSVRAWCRENIAKTAVLAPASPSP